MLNQLGHSCSFFHKLFAVVDPLLQSSMNGILHTCFLMQKILQINGFNQMSGLRDSFLMISINLVTTRKEFTSINSHVIIRKRIIE